MVYCSGNEQTCKSLWDPTPKRLEVYYEFFVMKDQTLDARCPDHHSSLLCARDDPETRPDHRIMRAKEKLTYCLMHDLNNSFIPHSLREQ